MIASGLKVYMTVAYGRLNGIFNGKAVSSHLKRFPSTGAKSFEPIDEYLDTAWAHPTGHHWVYNFLLPTLIIHQFEHAEWEGNHYFKHIMMECTLLARYNTFVTQNSTCWRYTPNLVRQRQTWCPVHLSAEAMNAIGILCSDQIGSKLQSESARELSMVCLSWNWQHLLKLCARKIHPQRYSKKENLKYLHVLNVFDHDLVGAEM